MTPRTAIISIALCLTALSGCTTMPQPKFNLLALTEPTPGPTKAIDELKTEGDERDFVIQSNAALHKANADKARIRALVVPKPSLWQRFRNLFGTRP